MAGGGSAPTQQTVTQVTVPEYLRPYVESNVGRAAALTDWGQNPYQSYGGQQIAGFAPEQIQAFQNIAGMQTSPQLTDASNLAYTAGIGGLGFQDTAQQLQGQAAGYGQQAAGYGQGAYQQAMQTNQQAANLAQQYGNQGATYGERATNLGSDAGSYALTQGRDVGLAAGQYGNLGSQYGSMGAQYGSQGAGIGALGVGAAQQGFGAQDAYRQEATSADAMGDYMSPYMQNVVDIQKREAIRDYGIQQTGRNAQAVGAGAFGGSRQAIVDAEANRNLNTQLQDIQARGQQDAFTQARQAQQFGSSLGLQGLQAGLQGLQTGLAGTAQGIQGAQAGMQGAQVGLQGTGQQLQAGQLGLAGYDAAMRGQQLGMQGAQTGLQGVGQLINAGQLGLQGAQTGIQGAQAGLQGVGQGINAGQLGLAGLGAAGQAASTLGSLGQAQYQQQMGLNQALMGIGQQRQQLQQLGLDRQYQDYLAQLQYPYQQTSFLQGIYQGLPMNQGTSGVYQNPSMVSQVAGLGTAATGLAGLYGRKKGGVIGRKGSGLAELALRNVTKGAKNVYH